MSSLLGRLWPTTLPQRLAHVWEETKSLPKEELTSFSSQDLITLAGMAHYDAQQTKSRVVISVTQALRRVKYETLDWEMGKSVPFIKSVTSDVNPVLGLPYTQVAASATQEEIAALGLHPCFEGDEYQATDPTVEMDLPAIIRRHRPRSLARKFHETLRSMSLPNESWLVSHGIDLVFARDVVERARAVLLGLGRDAKVLPSTPIKSGSSEKSWSRFVLRIGGDELEVVPELYAKLALYAAFRKRDHNLLLTLKGHAITWLKEGDITFRDGFPAAIGSSMLAWCPSEPEEAAMRLTASAGVRERAGHVHDWLDGGINSVSLGLVSWWSSRYHVSNWMGWWPRTTIPTA